MIARHHEHCRQYEVWYETNGRFMSASGAGIVNSSKAPHKELRRRLQHGARSFFPQKRWSKMESIC